MIVDDVVTAGTAVREVVGLVRAAGATVAGIVLGLDRDERGQGSSSAVQELSMEFSCPVISIVRLDDIVGFLEHSAAYREFLPELRRYREQWGATSL
jgi:orotate phosphoribosyltransferase